MFDQNEQRFLKPLLWLIRVIGVIVPRRLRADWRQEWEAELQYREMLIIQWGKLDRRAKLALLWHSLGAFADALWMQPRRMEVAWLPATSRRGARRKSIRWSRSGESEVTRATTADKFAIAC